MEAILYKAFNLFVWESDWILWNLGLACLPLSLSFGLFRRRSHNRSWLWWMGVAVFLVVLPNAPYLLTDIIHLIRAIRADFSVWMITLGLLPLHLGTILVGFEAYVVSLMNQGRYIQRQGAGHMVVWTELITHALCAVGVYLGRFQRFNSWDLVVAPGNVLLSAAHDMTAKHSLVVIGITFVILTILYWFMKQLTLGILLRLRDARVGSKGYA
jgi:uncharacterized membrane protein